jgi:excisionase family DNA binding protein
MLKKTEDELMTRQEVADYLKVSLRTVDTLIHKKDFDAMVHIGKNVRIFKSKLIKYLENKIC